MIHPISFGVLALAFVAAEATAQQPLYAQCGGNGWSGGTACVSGATCTKINDWYSQCLPAGTATLPTTTSETASKTTSTTTRTTSTTASGTTPTGNPFTGKEIYANARYKGQIQDEYNSLISQGNTALANKVVKLSSVGVGIWIAERAAVPGIGTHLQDANNIQTQTGKKQIVTIVVYDLPDRDCAGETKYQEYITAVAAQIKAYPNVAVAIILEPDSVGNMITSQSIPFCATASPVHKRGLAYAISVLGALPSVNLYLDGAHATWLGWPDNLAPTANLLGSIYTAAKQLNPGAVVRGISTDVSNYNALSVETTYHANLKPYLDQVGYPAHFVVDQGRSGNQNSSRAGEDWCNYKYAGLGERPTASTSSLLDAILWVKPPGESDGTSDPTSSRYNPLCASAAAFVPSAESGMWGSAAFRSMVQYANPPL